MSYSPLPRDFYAAETTCVAKALLGKILVRRLPRNAFLEGRIVEVEAYRGEDDPASHAYRGPSHRNAVMFQRVGLAYVYFIYGNHYCLNATARSESEMAGAVLIRALEPVKGIARMARNRDLLKKGSANGSAQNTRLSHLIANGPGKLAQAMEITVKLNGLDMTNPRSELFIIERSEGDSQVCLESSSRMGVTLGRDKPWRFYVRGNEFLSKP